MRRASRSHCNYSNSQKRIRATTQIHHFFSAVALLLPRLHWFALANADCTAAHMPKVHSLRHAHLRTHTNARTLTHAHSPHRYTRHKYRYLEVSLGPRPWHFWRFIFCAEDSRNKIGLDKGIFLYAKVNKFHCFLFRLSFLSVLYTSIALFAGHPQTKYDQIRPDREPVSIAFEFFVTCV